MSTTPYRVINLKEGSSNLTKFTERSWNSIELLDDSGLGTSLNKSSFDKSFNRSSFGKNQSRKRKRVPVKLEYKKPNSEEKQQQKQSKQSNQENNNKNLDENYYIENIESDDELTKNPIEDGQLVFKLNKIKKTKLNDEIDQCINLDNSSDRFLYFNRKNNLNETDTFDELIFNKSIEQKTKNNQIESPSSLIKTTEKFRLPLSHSTPKVGLKLQKKLEQIENDFLPNKNRIDLSKTPLKTVSQNIITSDKPINLRAKSPVKTPIKTLSQQISPVNSPTNSQRISPVDSPTNSPEQIYKLKRPVLSNNQSIRKLKVNYDNNFKRLNNNGRLIRNNDENNLKNVNDKLIDNEKKNLTPVKSQYISQVVSPAKTDCLLVKESRNFLTLSNKMSKLIEKYNRSKFNASKNMNGQQLTISNLLFESVYNQLEARKHWLSLMKNDEIKRDSLFLRLTKVRQATNGFVDCDCEIDFNRTKEEFVFKYTKLKTLIPTYYANDYEISYNAILEYISPWYTYDNSRLETTFIINPFYIHIIDHGKPNGIVEEYEVIYRNPNFDH